jgi:2-oxo-hept-3-ene-1,7-dioate hydratase
MMTADQIEAAAEALDRAERTRRQIGLLSLAHPGMTLADAYAVQRAWVGRKLAAGRSRIGYKIGLTSRAMQAALGIAEPDSGVLFEDMRFSNGATVPKDRFIAPRIEAELAFVLERPLAGPAVDEAAVMAATGAVYPALEILDTRILRADPATGKPRSIVDTVADNAANAGIVLGDRPLPHRDIDLAWVGAIVGRNGIVEETGLAAGVLGHPARGIAWLANRLAEQGFPSLKAGAILLAGSFIRPLEAEPGSAIDADFGAWGRVTCAFA